MLFHTPTQARGFTSEGGASAVQYALDLRRVLLGVGLLLGIVIAAFVAQARGWSEGTTTFLHLTEVLAGGLVGLIIGEHSRVNTSQ